MRYQGSLQQWNDERGFGWIAVDGAGAQQVFVHISAFMPRPAAHQRPYAGMRLEFAVGVEGGKKKAKQVSWQAASAAQASGSSRPSQPLPRVQGQGHHRPQVQARGRRPSPHPHRGSGSSVPLSGLSRLSYAALLLWLLILLGGAMLSSVPRWVWLLYPCLSVVTFMAYWQDKWAAQLGRWRTPENTLQTLALAGGWPGAILAQQWLRHKSSKPAFQRQFWAVVLLNLAALVWLLSPYGQGLRF